MVLMNEKGMCRSGQGTGEGIMGIMRNIPFIIVFCFIFIRFWGERIWFDPIFVHSFALYIDI